jgi:putative flippase GtrA
MGIGVLSTVAYALIYLLARGALGPGLANALALAVTAVANTAANRLITFGVRGRRGLLRQFAMGSFVYALTLGLTTGALAVLHGIEAAPSPYVEVAVLVVAGAAATVTRYVALRSWVFARARRHPLPASAGPLPASAVPLPASAGPLPASAGPLPASAGPLPASAGPLPASAGPLPASPAVDRPALERVGR